jgi:CheY-like chemotaxis protein
MMSEVWRVLVVEGDAEVRDVVDDLLVDEGFEVREVANVDDALLELDKTSFDVLLCHLALLRSANDRLSRQLREIQPTPRIVAMSASGAHARSDEANENLSKPFTRSQLLEAIRPR